MLSFRQVACRRGPEVLFTGVDVTIYRGQKIGVTGANGCGKSSLFGMVLGELDPDEGSIDLQQDLRVVHVEQETRTSGRTALDFVIDGDRHLRDVEARIEALQQSERESGNVLAEALAEFDRIDGYTAVARAGSLLNGLGFSTLQQQQRVSDFSGGWRVRLNLARALMAPGDLLLLDEPTNHLDLNAVIWLEQWLQRFDGSLLLISHDRDFLDHTVQAILHIEAGEVRLYGGNYSAFEKLRAERLAGQQQAYVRQQRKIQEIQRFVDRFRAKATKARQAQSRLKMLSRMVEISPAHVDSGFRFRFEEPAALPDPLIRLDDVSAGYDDKPILQGIKWSLNCGDRIGLLGRNGAGKSTLLKTLVGELPLLAGERIASAGLCKGYFAQHQIDQLEYAQSPLAHMLEQEPEMAELAARNYLGSYGFHGDQVLRPVEVLSGGEKARLALALIARRRPNLLLLDEPTNHLDLSMRQALAEALQHYPGALIVISHDRFLLNSTVDRFVLVADGRLQDFDDDLAGYARWLSTPTASRKATPAAAAPTQAGKSTRVGSRTAEGRKQRKQQEADRRRQLRPLQKKTDELEGRNNELQDSLDQLQRKLADNQLYSNENKSRLAELLQQQARLKSEQAQVEHAWFEAMERLEQALHNGDSE